MSCRHIAGTGPLDTAISMVLESMWDTQNKHSQVYASLYLQKAMTIQGDMCLL